jgi:hypothetical protein
MLLLKIAAVAAILAVALPLAEYEWRQDQVEVLNLKNGN